MHTWTPVATWCWSATRNWSMKPCTPCRDAPSILLRCWGCLAAARSAGTACWPMPAMATPNPVCLKPLEEPSDAQPHHFPGPGPG
ncbi:hypothetical protein G6F24_017717 [Rhizopus arrhizus]|nr:hypothetical protein G6F24_017717 [Rhizopus arrhizus]